MRIAHTTDSGGIYGKERVILNLAAKQKENGHDVSIVCMTSTEFAEEASKKHHTAFCRDVKQLTDHVIGQRFDIIHTHDYKTGVTLALRNIGARPSLPLIRTVHGYTGFGKPWYSRIKIYEAIDKFTHRFNQETIAVSDPLGVELGARVIHNGIEPMGPSELPRGRFNQNIIDFCSDGFVFCCMARLSHEKNLSNLIDAVLQLDGAKLLLFGDGPLRAELMKKTQYATEKVFMAGFDPESKHYLPFVNAYIQPSLTEGMPISVLEAMSLGKPLMTTQVGGMKILHRAGAAASCNNGPNVMAQAMLSFMHDHNRRDALAKRGLELFNQMFSADAMYREYQKIYQSIAQLEA